ncbi:MAG TPA: PA14 domain-containing protein [Verrucomicrobiae bacterium]|nr:PA14 domain-containing protein [Verrucomicrobiae bacterium]
MKRYTPAAALLAGSMVLASAALPVRADTIKTVDGKVYRGATQITNGVLSITDTNGSANTVALTNLDAAIFADISDVIPGEHSLAPPWASQDIGSVASAGGARQAGNSFVIRASGIGVTPKIDGFHFVFQPMAGNAEITARVTTLEGGIRGAQAGLMIRQTLGPESAHAAVLLNRDEASSFQWRQSRKKVNPALTAPKAAAPSWLKLEKRDNFYIGSISDDGKTWKTVGGQTIKLSPTRNREDLWQIGLVVSSHTNGGLCTAMFDEVRVHSYGLKADFFSDDFRTISRKEILPAVNRLWEENRPFAVRCTGEIIPKRSDAYSFTVEPKDASQLWIGEKLVFSATKVISEPIALKKDEAYVLKLESKLAETRRSALRLYWSSRTQRKEIVPPGCLRPYSESEITNATIAAHEIDLTRSQSAVAGVLLTNGTVLAGKPVQLTDTTLVFEPAGPNALPVKLNLHDIARVQFRPMSPQLAARIASAIPGVLLANGDFIEGELKEFSKGHLTISSVIFGLRSFDLSSQAVAIVLRPFQTEAKFVVRTSSGSALFVDSIELGDKELLVAEPILGSLRFSPRELLDIRRRPPGT